MMDGRTEYRSEECAVSAEAAHCCSVDETRRGVGCGKFSWARQRARVGTILCISPVSVLLKVNLEQALLSNGNGTHRAVEHVCDSLALHERV